MIQREWKEKDISEAFFPVVEKEVRWVDEKGITHRIPDQRAIVDATNNKVLSVVSKQYHLITNKRAYDLSNYIVQKVFPGTTLANFKCFNIYMPMSKGSCRIDLIIPHSYKYPFGNHDKWIPFVRISNSYNRTFVLQIEIGFCRWICLNGVIFNMKGFTIRYVHTHKKIREGIDKIEKGWKISQAEEINALWERFEERLKRLKSVEVPQWLILPIYCKVFGLEIDQKKITKTQEFNYYLKAKQILNSAKEYFEELGSNAYALFNVLTDYASFPDGTSYASNYIHGYQKKVGNWIDDFLIVASKKDFLLTTYLGEKEMKTAYYLESLISKRNDTQSSE